jgi:hypothetical protein
MSDLDPASPQTLTLHAGQFTEFTAISTPLTFGLIIRNAENSPVFFTVSFVLPFSVPAFLPDFSTLIWRFLDIVAKKITKLF